MKLIPRLKEKYIKEIVPTLCKNLSFSNKMQAPKLVKIVLNMGLGLDGTDNIFDEFKKSGFISNHELVTDSMLNSLCIAGSPDEAKLQLKKFTDAGIDLPIIQFNPVGNTIESFSLLKKTLLDEQ